MENQLLGASDPGPSGVSRTPEKEIDYSLEVAERKANDCKDFLDRKQVDGDAVDSSEEEGAADESSGVEVEEDGEDVAAGHSRGDGDAVGEVAASQSWYRPNQRKKGRRGRGGRKKNRSRKRGITDNKSEGALNGEPTKPEINKGKNIHSARNQLMRSEDGPTPLTATSGSTRRFAGSFGNSSYSERRPGNLSRESAVTTNSRFDRPELFGDRPRNRPRTEFSRRQAAAARYARGRSFDDFNISIHLVVVFPPSLIHAMMYDMALMRLFRNLRDSDLD